MSDRREQARAEAERQIHVYGDDFKARTLRANLNDAFVQGVEWADANPQPHTITREDLVETAAKVSERFGGIQSPGALRTLFAVALADLGIEVEDDDD